MTKIVVTDTAVKAGEPWAYAPVHVDLVDANGDTVHPAYVTLTGVLVEAFDTTADADGTFTVTLDPTDAIAPSGDSHHDLLEVLRMMLLDAERRDFLDLDAGHVSQRPGGLMGRGRYFRV